MNSDFIQKNIKPPKKTLDDLMRDESIVTGKKVIQELKDKEIRQKEFEDSIEFEQRNRRSKP